MKRNRGKEVIELPLFKTGGANLFSGSHGETLN